jgi:uncharacterized protein
MVITTRREIDEFLEGKRIAVIGVSRNPQEYSRLLFQELIRHGYDTLPINPSIDELDGSRCYKTIAEISPSPDRALIILPKDKTEQAVSDCAHAGIRHVWLHRHLAGGVSDTAAVSLAKEKGIQLITGYCLLMFLPKASFFHKLHGGILGPCGLLPK